MWARGWAPTDVVHAVGRRFSARHVEVTAAAVRADARRRTERGQSLHPTWQGQPDDIGEHSRPAGHLRPGDAVRVLVEVVSLLVRLVEVPPTIPRPGGTAATATLDAAHLNPRMLGRVRALLAKAESSEFEEEAEAFTAKAQELIARHAIDEALLPTVDDVGDPSWLCVTADAHVGHVHVVHPLFPVLFDSTIRVIVRNQRLPNGWVAKDARLVPAQGRVLRPPLADHGRALTSRPRQLRAEAAAPLRAVQPPRRPEMTLHSKCTPKKGSRVDLPEPDRQLLDPPPARHVICQLRFETSDRVGTSDIGKQWADKLSDQLPGFDQLQGEVMTIQGGANQPAPRIEQTTEPGWRFSDDGDQTVVTLLPASLALETSAYPGWDEFVAQFEKLLALLNETIGPAVEKRLGLRYINELSPGPDAVAAEVDREVLALRVHPQVGDGVVRVEQRAIVDFGDRKVASVRFLSSGEDEPSILDIDAYRETGRPFSTSAVRVVLGDLNTHALSLFQACLSDEYLAQLRAEQETT